MEAQVGDWLVVRGRRVGDGHREGQVVEVPHADGSPPYRVRWLDQERSSLVFPGPECTVHRGPASSGTDHGGRDRSGTDHRGAGRR